MTCSTLFLVLTVSVFVPQNFPIAPPAEKDMVVIDGSKEPGRIPQHAAWNLALRRIARASEVPTEVFKYATSAERDIILRAAEASRRNDEQFDEYRLKIREQLLGVYTACKGDKTCEKKAADGFNDFKDREISYRQRTLDIRDQVLEDLRRTNTTVALALGNWVEGVKAGITVSMRKSDEGHYRRPE